MNVAHEEIKLFDPRSNFLTAGFTHEKRSNFTKLLNRGFIDVNRHLNTNERDAYTFWTNPYKARMKNECTIRNDIHGSDHCPIVAQFKLHNNNRKEETSPCLSKHELKDSKSESPENSSNEDTERESARLLPIQCNVALFSFKGPLTAHNNVSQESVKISKIVKPGRQS